MSPPDCDEGSRVEVDRDLFERPRVPIHTPAVFLEDAMRPSISPEDRAAVMLSLQRQYARTRGYVDSWGHVAVHSVYSYQVYRFVPVQMWERTALARADCRYTIPSLVAATHGTIRGIFRGRVPWGVVLSGITSVGRLNPHALFCLVVPPQVPRDALAQWAASDLLPQILPVLLRETERRVVAALKRTHADTSIDQTQDSVGPPLIAS